MLFQVLRSYQPFLNGCLQQAMKNGLIERNPVKLAELPRQTGAKKGRTAMTKEQQELFMKYAEESYLYHFFSVSFGRVCEKVKCKDLNILT